ncbi:MAG: glycosyltransferase [Candidatus Eremiobacteraeota bacterium]|nr:glycosyltransferase [Candidatus Eremiobacteraeota bacterium]
MNVLLWHVHGSWTTTFVQGTHRYVFPVLPDRSADGRGRARTWDWPKSAIEIAPENLAFAGIDFIVLQRPHEFDLVRQWMGVTPGVDVPAVYLEHNAPQGRINDMFHPMGDKLNVPVVHVTHFNRLFWDCGDARTYVIEHGIIDPGHLYTGELERCAVVINEPGRRARVTGTDLLERFSAVAPVDLFGMGVAAFGGYEDLPQQRMHSELARRRVYVHPIRWTSLGLSLIEAMQLGMPVVALATTEVPHAVHPDVGIVSTDVDALVEASRQLLNDPVRCTELGGRARAYACERFGLERFLRDWDSLIEEMVS